MAKFTFGRKDPAGNAKGRAAIFFFVIILITGLLIGYIIYKRHTGIQGQANLAGTPSVESIPGV